MVRLAEDVAYLLAHSENVTNCGADGNLHAGDGTCVDPVPNCDKPDAPKGEGGEVVRLLVFVAAVIVLDRMHCPPPPQPGLA